MTKAGAETVSRHQRGVRPQSPAMKDEPFARNITPPVARTAPPPQQSRIGTVDSGILSQRCFADERDAIRYVEAVAWPDGPVCPHCGTVGKYYDLSNTRLGLKKCAACRKQFTVRIGTIFQSSPIPLYKWLQAIYLVHAGDGLNAHQLHRTLEVTYKTAWHMVRKLRALTVAH